MKSVLGFLVIALTLFAVVRADYIIDNFGTVVANQTDRINLQPSRLYNGLALPNLTAYRRFSFNPISNVTTQIYPNLYLSESFQPQGAIFGGTRRIIIQTLTADFNYAPTSGVGVFVGGNQLSSAVGPDMTAAINIYYVGNYIPPIGNCTFPNAIQCDNQLALGPLLTTGIDVTQGGINQAFAFTIIFADSTQTGFTVTFYNDPTRFATARRQKRPGTRAEDGEEEFDDGIISYEVPLAQPKTFSNGKKATVGTRYIIPFTGIAPGRGSTGEVDFTQIRGITFQISGFLAADNTVQDFRTVPLVAQTKQGVIIESVAVDNVAEPSEILNYTLTVSVAQDIDSVINNIFLYDNPTRNYGSTNYATFLPNTVTLTAYQYYQVNCSSNQTVCQGSYTVDPTNFGAQILNGSNDPSFQNRIAIYFPSISSGSYVTVNYQMQVPNLPCLMDQCSQGCSFATQPSVTGGQCYCQINQARVCLGRGVNRTAEAARLIDANNSTSAIIDQCSPTTDVTTGSTLTVTPIGTTPNPALTIAANPTQKANGVFPGGNLTYTVTLTNNRTRSSDSFVVNLTPDQYSVCQVGPNSPNPNFTADATTGNPVYSVAGGLQFGQTLTFSITCTAVANLACGVNLTTLAAAINFGSNTVNCPELTAADNFGSDFIPLIGAPQVTLTKSNATAITYGANANNVASFTINYSNVGQRTASNVVITETVPQALTQFYQTSDNPSFQSSGGNNYSYTFNLAAGQNGSVSFLFRVPPTINDCVTGNYINTVSSSAVCGGQGITAVAYVGVNALPDMAVTISNVSSTVQPGQQVCYNVQYQNIGYRVAQSVVLSIVLPAFTNYSASGSANWVQSGTSNVYTLTVGDVQGQSALASAQFCVVANSNTVCGSFFSTNVNVTSLCQNFPEQNLVNNFAQTTTTSIAGTVTLTLTKTPSVNGAAATSVNTGSTIVYAISGSNTGSSQAQNVTITETLPAGVTVSSNLGGFVAGGSNTYVYRVGNVNAGSTFGPFNFSVVVPSSVECPAPSITNTASVTETCTGATASATATVQIIAFPQLTVTAQNPSTVTLSQTQQVCVAATYGNTGNQTANNSTLTLSYGAYLTPVSGANNGWTQTGNGVLTFSAGNINSGSSALSPSACFTITTPIPCGVNNLNFTFVLTSPCAPGQAPSSPTTVGIIANPVFTITKTNSLNGAQASPGAAVTYTITYANTGNQIADNTVLNETVPALLTPGSNPGWNCNGQTCTYNVGSLSPTQGTQTVTFNGILSSNVPGQSNVQNTVSISSQPCAAFATANSLLTVAGYPNLVLRKTDGGITVQPGDYIYYTISYTNAGDSSAPNSVITDVIPAFSMFNASLSTAGWQCPDGAGAGTTCTVNVGTVAPGQSGTVSLVVKTADWIRCGTDFTQNNAFIATTIQESNYNDNNATVRTPITGEPNLIIMKESNTRSMGRAYRVAPGELITYNITYANIGLRDATDTLITETVPEFTTYVAAASSSWSCADGSPAGTVCQIAVNSSLYPNMMGFDLQSMAMGMMGDRLTFSVRVNQDLPPTAHITTNCVSINNTCGECNPFDNMACYTVNLFGVPDLVINATGQCRSIHWYIEWQNVGDQAASNVIVTDNVPQGTNFNAAESDSRWVCNNNTASAQFGQCTLNVGEVSSGSGGSALFITSPQTGTALTTFTNTGSIAGTGRNPDPTPQNNQDTASVGFEGCPDACDSCCPISNECCPDKTDVTFTFQGLLQGINQCQSSSSSS